MTRRTHDTRNPSVAELTKEDHCLFPALTSNRQGLQIGTSITSGQIKSFLDRCVIGLKQEGVDLLGQGGQYTLHCFRRRGAQHRFFESNRTWPLDAIKFWGGWSEKDGQDTIINYLLNEWESRYLATHLVNLPIKTC